MNFVKYPSLENLHNVKTPILSSDLVAVTEKIDGSNCSIVMNPAYDYQFASRNQVTDNTWNNIENVVGEDLIQKFYEIAYDLDLTIQVYGEIFSSRILKRIPYGATKVRWFDIRVDGELQSPKVFYQLMEKHNIKDVVPFELMTYYDFVGLNVDDLKTQYADDAIAEGVVAKSWNGHFDDGYGNTLIIKKKSSGFSELKKIHKPKTEEPLTEVQLKLLGYVNESRVKSAESKIGEFNMKLTGQFIKEVSKDAIEDFVKETPGVNKKDYMSKEFSNRVRTTIFDTFGVK